ncbi:aminotransferase class I/II-fold pyridoxal phosphate-dependent enzyme [Aspergillus saccharolyticus JOP 1030-1]|uniref:Class II aminotransferase/8-amino-7-oxononanoate synthase n=1 Tax=Aspergillus saccharolyticus JOP 1030-1 TaxID=1450539 RepID=A0A318Z8E5_9EURO|nr:class II aminotransferase/8-amino-7-oxononanoate synthase [Aspergillus saccharolyticus JOP 1030-1]PYH43605.1 class II aminotransferase/8-amino-7-oxononanoate synthase [Aspergillus saccharolyticus JOP 1030-1]
MTLGQEILYQKLQLSLNRREREGRLIEPASHKAVQGTIDFGSNDTLSLSSSGMLSQAFLQQLEMHPHFTIGASTTRVFEGTRQYLADLERDLAAFYQAEDAMIFNSGYDANVAVWFVISQPGDIVVFDELMHACARQGIRNGRAKALPFMHNDTASLQHYLNYARAQNPGIAEGNNVIFICFESVYSMDGDEAPIHEIVRVASESLPLGNYVLVVDEAHSHGLVGPNGAGLVRHHGLEKDFTIRVQTYSKALGSSGGVVLCNNTIKQILLNYSKNVIFTTAPSFVSVAAMRAGYEILASEDGEKRRARLQHNIGYTYWTLTDHPRWQEVKDRGIIRLPTERGWQSRVFKSAIFGLITQPGKARYLAESLQQAGFWVNAVEFPIVPKELGRVRLMIHADNTAEQIDTVVQMIMRWAVGQMKLDMVNSNRLARL